MAKLAVLLVILAGVVLMFVGSRKTSRINSGFIVDSLKALVAYALFCAAGFALVWWLTVPPAPFVRTLVAVAAVLLWIGYGAIWLIRLAPRLRKPPQALAEVGIIDAGLVAAGLAALGYLAIPQFT